MSAGATQTSLGIALAERGLVTDGLVRGAIRRLLARRLDDLRRAARGDADAFEASFAEQLRRHAVAENTREANAQHYEVPTAFFKLILGPRLKYSSACFPGSESTLAEAEEAMLAVTSERAQLRDGLDILELGCGWGSLTLWMAEHFPNASITAVTNSATQAEYVQAEARARNLPRVRVQRANVDTFHADCAYDRIVSVEMFEHVRNYGVLFERLPQWMNPGGLLFIHVFAHRLYPYLFETDGADNWMGRYFFTGGTMPSHGLLPRFAGSLVPDGAWRVSGTHYARTLEAWLVNLDRNRGEVRELFNHTYGRRAAAPWVNRWRIFLMACAELFAYEDGGEWGVSHYRFAKRLHGPPA